MRSSAVIAQSGAWVSGRDCERLEKLSRYAARPAVAESRLVELSDGRIGYSVNSEFARTERPCYTQGRFEEAGRDRAPTRPRPSINPCVNRS
jgi:hypothetical protein